MKIWAKTINEDKITRSVLFEPEKLSNIDEFVSAMQQICEKMDIPTPLITNVNFNHFVMFNNTRFKTRDFVESIDFELLDVEAVPDKHRK